MTISVVRVRTRETLCHPDVAQLIMRGARESGLPSGPLVLAELVDQVASPKIGIFIGFDGHDPRAVAVAQLPSSAFHLAPMVTLAYSESGRALSIAVGERLRNWLKEAGFGYAMAINRNHTERAFKRGLAYFGVPSRVGELIEFRL